MTLSLYHIEHLSNDPAILRFARNINGSFKRSKLTDLEELDSEYEAVYLWSNEDERIASIVVFCRFDKNEYYIPIIWTSPKHRGQGCMNKLLKWLKEYAASKGAKRLSTDVHYSNNPRMVEIMDKAWKRSYLRYTFSVGRS